MRGTKKQKDRLLELMDKLEPGSDQYNAVAEQYERICRCEAEEHKWLPNIVSVVNMAIGCVTTTLQVRSVLKHEDRGNIVTTKSLGYAQKMPQAKIEPTGNMRMEAPPKRGGK